MKRQRIAAFLLALAMAMPLSGCAEGYEPADIAPDHIDTGIEGSGPKLSDYVNEGLEQAKTDGVYHETDYSGITATPHPEGYGTVDPDRLYSGTDGPGAGTGGQEGPGAEPGDGPDAGTDMYGDPGSAGTGTDAGQSAGSQHGSGTGQAQDGAHGFIGMDHGAQDQDAMVPWLLEQDYGGEPYIDVHVYEPCFTADELSMDWPVEYYSELDELGRTQFAFACLDGSLMPPKGTERGDISSVCPSGWEQEKYDGIGNGGWLYNRCHLVAWALAGEDANERNLMTGTRYFNADGMLPFERQTLEYLDAHPENHVLYRATPVYDGDDLLADGLLLEARSLEDDGQLRFCVYIFNVQPGIKIDYGTGESEPAK